MQSGEIVLLKEVRLDRDVVGKCLRVTGHVALLDFANHICQIEHAGAVLWVDIGRVDIHGANVKISSLVQFIGEVRITGRGDFSIPAEYGKDEFYLLAKVVRLVDGLDMALFEQAIQARRDFVTAQTS